jgi:hypothetical protein
MIYYGAAAGLIKIGYTHSRLRERTLRHRQKRSDYIVLTAREGDPHEEARTHRMFRHLLLDGEREWFHPGPDLLAHLCIVARGDYAPPPDVRDEPIGLDDF